ILQPLILKQPNQERIRCSVILVQVRVQIGVYHPGLVPTSFVTLTVSFTLSITTKVSERYLFAFYTERTVRVVSAGERKEKGFVGGHTGMVLRGRAPMVMASWSR